MVLSISSQSVLHRQLVKGRSIVDIGFEEGETHKGSEFDYDTTVKNIKV